MQKNIRFTPPWELAEKAPHSAVLLAFSGGADSCALLHLLAQDARKEGYELLLAHVNHGIRGEEALRDRAFCERIAKQYRLEICFADLDVPALAKQSGRGLEEEAREARYAFFAELMQARKIGLLATAHHADDNLETILFRIARGTSLRGLGGIHPTRAFGSEGILVRPLLQATRQEILQYCEQNCLEYVTDSTNADTAYSRNRLRADVIPVLEELFANPQHRAIELCEQMRADEDFLSAAAEAFLRENLSSKGLPIHALKALHASIKRRALLLYFCERIGSDPEGVHLSALVQMLEQGCNGLQVTLPNGWCAVTEGGYFCLRLQEIVQGKPFRFAFLEGCQSLPESNIKILVKKDERATNVHNLSTTSYINLKGLSAIMIDTLYWRSRQEGDTIYMGGMTRKLRKLYNQKQIPLRLREQLPLLCDEQGIVWAPFVGARDGLAADDGEWFVCVQVSDTLKE